MQAGQSVDDGGLIDRADTCVGQRQGVGLEGDSQAAQVADVLSNGQGAVDVRNLPLRCARGLVLGGDDLGSVGVVLADERTGALGEGLPVLPGPPVADLPRAVEGGSLVVEAVADLVADDGADARVVHGVVRLRVEEGRLKDRGGEDDLVHRGVVIGVNRLRRHVPLVPVHRLGQLVQRVGHVGPFHTAHRGQDVPGGDLDGGVVAPAHRIADLGGEQRQLVQGTRPRGRAHPLQRGDGLAVGLDEPADQFLHRRLVRRWEVAFHVDLSQCLAQAGLHQGDAALPTSPQLVGSLERAAVEVEVLLHEGA